MTEVHLGVIRRSRYIDRMIYEARAEDGRPTHHHTWIPNKGFDKLVEQFIRNQVLLEFSTNGFDIQTTDYDDINHIIDGIHQYCDTHCTGLWTRTQRYRRESDWDPTSQRSIPTGKGSGRITVHFENEADIEPFLKDCAVILKLSN